MKTLTDFIDESLILERNEKMFPKPGANAKMEIWTGDHCRDRQSERHVSNKEIVDAFFGAWSQLNKLYKEKKIIVSKRHGEDNHVIIIDARKDRSYPVNIAAYIFQNHGTTKLNYPKFIVKTVYAGPDFSGNIYDKENAEKIFLY